MMPSPLSANPTPPTLSFTARLPRLVQCPLLLHRCSPSAVATLWCTRAICCTECEWRRASAGRGSSGNSSPAFKPAWLPITAPLVHRYRDSATCEEHGHEWFARCAREGNAICQGLHANKVGQVPGATAEVTQQQVLEWNRKAAENGLGWSMLKLARASLKRLPSALPYDPKMAARWFRKGIATWQDPECLYGLAQVIAKAGRLRTEC